MCYRTPVLGVYPNYEVVEFQPTTVIPPEPRLCCFWLRIYSFTAPSLPYSFPMSLPGGHPPTAPTPPTSSGCFCSHHAALLCVMICHYSMCIPHKSQRGRGSVTSWTTATLDLKWRYMKCSRSLPALCTINRRPRTGHFTSYNNLGKYTKYVEGPTPTLSTPLVR